MVDLALVERWLKGWSLSRGVPLPVADGGGLRVDVGMPLQRRRHVFLDAGPELQRCAAGINAPLVFLKAPVEPEVLRKALPERWKVEEPGYLMRGPASMPSHIALPDGYRVVLSAEHGAQVVNLLHASGDVAATGRIVIHGATAIFDQIVTDEAHRRRGLGTIVMQELDALAVQANVNERLLVATPAGRGLYLGLGWRDLAPWSTAVLP